jgi:adenine-specific DNA-methyltransferase
VLDHAEPSLFSAGPAPTFDLVITNPPYFKVRKDEKLARVMGHVVHGQPNVYAFFLAVAAGLLRDGGGMVAITPRSYFNGPYFRRFRKWFFDRMTIRGVHVFESRADAFRESAVLQENVILLAEKGGEPADVTVSSSPGRDFLPVERHVVPYARVVEDTSGDHVIRVATGGLERRVVEAVDGLPCRFRDLPFRVSTGRVVTFRSTTLLRHERSAETAPLLWMHNVRPFVTRFPARTGKPTHIVVSDESERLLVPARRYVLLKRFTAKEEKRRLVAGIVEPKDSYAPVLGLENHLNYVYRTEGELSEDEALGLAALFNSALMDLYFRAVSGSTQVNATEVRGMPVPAVETIRAIGRAVRGTADVEAPAVERVVATSLGLPDALVGQLCEAAR